MIVVTVLFFIGGMMGVTTRLVGDLTAHTEYGGAGGGDGLAESGAKVQGQESQVALLQSRLHS
jgi:hypothetical protein